MDEDAVILNILRKVKSFLEAEGFMVSEEGYNLYAEKFESFETETRENIENHIKVTIKAFVYGFYIAVSENSKIVRRYVDRKETIDEEYFGPMTAYVPLVSVDDINDVIEAMLSDLP